MKTITVTQHEINQATRPNVYRNRKKYTRKDKHRNKNYQDYFVYLVYKKKVMFTAIEKSGKDYMGFIWFEVFKNGKTTWNSYNALNEEHAIKMHKQFKGLK